MDVSAVSAFTSVPINKFLMTYEFGKFLSEGKTSKFVTFRLLCREFIDRLVVMLLKTTSATSAISKGLYSFCPELMLEDDDNTAFALFAGLCKVLETCGVISTVVSRAAVKRVYQLYSGTTENPFEFWAVCKWHYRCNATSDVGFCFSGSTSSSSRV